MDLVKKLTILLYSVSCTFTALRRKAVGFQRRSDLLLDGHFESSLSGSLKERL